jgi:hypothetical protein
MRNGWKTKLRVLGAQEPDQQRLRRLVEGGSRSLAGGEPSTRSRAAAAVLAVVVCAGVVSLVWFGIGGQLGPPSVGSATPTPSGAPAPTEQEIGYHGLLVTVPASWTINDQHCGTPKSDTVLRDLGGVLACLIPRPPGISSLLLAEDASSSYSRFQRTDTITNANGVRLERGRLPDDPGVAVYVRAVDVFMVIDTVTAAETKSIVESIRLADVDPNGCAMRESQLEPSGAYEPPASMHDVMIPGSPSSIAICHYVDRWLRSSAMLEGDLLSEFVEVVNGLAEGTAHAPIDTYDPSFCDEPSSEGGELGSGYVLWVHGIEPDPVPLWAHVGICGDLGIDSGARQGRLTPLFAKLLNRPLHVGYVMPGRLLPGPARD